MIKTALPLALIVGAFSMPWADNRSEEELSRQFEERVVKSFQLELAQADPYDTFREHAIEKRQREYNEYLEESAPREPQYIWTPDGRLQGWQQPDTRGNIQQYDLKGQWKGTIYNND